jgi:hypothetical protein
MEKQKIIYSNKQLRCKITSISSSIATYNAVKGTAGTTEYRWYSTLTGGSYVSLQRQPTITSTTTYYVTAFNGTCESLFRTAVLATIKPVPTLALPTNRLVKIVSLIYKLHLVLNKYFL